MLPILYQDAHLVAIDKPAGLLVHRSGLDAGETRFALQLLRDQLGRPVWPVHRLDKGSSGVLLFALDAASASVLGQALADGHAVGRRYLAMVRGWPPDAGLIDHPLKRLADDARTSARGLAVQPARTRYRTLARHALPLAYGEFAQTRCALLELQPETGRRHQLRRHCKHIAHPIIGDSTHGHGPLNRALAAWLGLQRLWLHAEKLQLPHPASGRPLVIQAPLGAEWSAWGTALPGQAL
ncbi:pseudouridine synthase [Ottowia sp.]|uniref:pseudouridine synthase n=1 Tax=Ottowia sp. TaxID=1898956 RepID=UPI002BC1B6BE|nr:pseudouridine synthase [Ottowia sp.]HRN76734.1 pseudouridine synthase [Ottowia sp.]HRQ03807.1 pseudouridine synthase [Ottowia sp.]